MKNTFLMKALGGAVIMSSLATNAYAGVITHTDSFALGSVTIADQETSTSGNAITSQTSTTSLNINGFDSSLGTLTGVEITFDTSWALNGRIEGWDTHNSKWFWDYVDGAGTASSTMEVSLTNPASSEEGKISSVTSSCNGVGWNGAYCTESNGISGDFNDSLDLSAISLNNFLDTTLVLEFEKELTAEVTSCGTWVSDDDKCRMTNYNNSWLGGIAVTYTYDEFVVAVPEPSSLALFGLGLIGLGFARRNTKA